MLTVFRLDQISESPMTRSGRSGLGSAMAEALRAYQDDVNDHDHCHARHGLSGESRAGLTLTSAQDEILDTERVTSDNYNKVTDTL